MDLIGEEQGRIDRLAGWLDATRAEAVGLAVLLIGGLLATGAFVWLALGRPDLAAADGREGVAAGWEGAAVATNGADGPLPGPADVGTGIGGGGAGVTADGGDRTAAAPDGAGGPGGSGAPDPDVSAGPSGAGPDGAGHGGAGHGGAVAVTVHVAGAVVAPGLVTLPAGARVGDAVIRAGGPLDDADLTRVNLARLLTDGEQVLVPREGEPLPPEPPLPPSEATPGASTGPTAGTPDGRIDLNRASVVELQALPGIGPTLAARIVGHRDQHGPFRTIGDLRAVSGIGERRLQELADLVVVR